MISLGFPFPSFLFVTKTFARGDVFVDEVNMTDNSRTGRRVLGKVFPSL